jgi:hypothetical protein
LIRVFLLLPQSLELEKTNPTERFTDLGKLNFPISGMVLGTSQFLMLPQLPLKAMLGLKVVKINSKISNLLR